MAVLACDVCGGKLVMGTGGMAVCDSCGMEHSKDRMQEKVQEIKGTVQVSNIAGIESLMKRGRLALEDSEWNQADEYFDKVLDIDAEYAPAYVGKLCSQISERDWRNWVENDLFAYAFKKEADLARYYKPLDDIPNYQKAIRFADETYRSKLEGYNNEIKKNIAELKKEYEFFMIISDSFWYCGNKRIYEDNHTEIRGTCLIGKLCEGLTFKILRTGREYYVGRLDRLFCTDYGDVKEGDIAVITHQTRKEKEQREKAQEEQRRQKEEQRKKAQEDKRRQEEQRHREEEELRHRLEQEAQLRVEQSKKWEQQGLCRHCGGTLGFLKKCKSCGQKN